ncbi:Bile acid transporter family protein [Croceitalea dokdonensis DOKDO 023]|uniref:Bile acid transporter family protein n=1 Tax=Croceitalea dokdonensis DOKDO 023 TaxID=1300341 RepID=A0A0P7AS54_9FLAO|nr:bile acid:sodium symporter family protein [Croceitalea dokdonensis]KPM30763.1 Bile acid transporter family protein [Croceitalea dokdonensis DOKDO 023]
MEAIIDTASIHFDKGTLWTLNLALALVMFGIALEISLSDFKELSKRPKLVLTGVASQFLVLPAITFLLVWLAKPYPSIALGMFMVAACPGGNISNFITHLAKGNAALSVTLTAIATLLAVVMTPVNLQFWGALYQPTAAILRDVAISPLEMVKLVALLLGVPLLLGMLVNYWKPRLASAMARYFKIGSLLFFVALVFLALYKNKEIFMEYVVYVFWLVLLHNFVAFVSGFSLAKLMGFSGADVKSITIETGIQNSGLGLLLIFTFFDGLGGMAVLTAFWGIWHLVSGLLLAGLWGYIPIKSKKLV